MIKRTFYNPETGTTETYVEVWKLEQMTVRDVTDLIVFNHYWQDEDGELWVDFEHPMENVRRSFAEYRNRKNYMQPDEVRRLREDLGLSVRDFAETLGIAPSSLTQVENDQRVQAKYQENLFEAARDSYMHAGHLPDDWINKNQEHRAVKTAYQVTSGTVNYNTVNLTSDDIKGFHGSRRIGEVA